MKRAQKKERSGNVSQKLILCHSKDDFDVGAEFEVGATVLMDDCGKTSETALALHDVRLIMAEIIDISDDDVLVDENPKKKGTTTTTTPGSNKRAFRCLNSDCRTEENLIQAEEYVRRYFGVLPYPKKKRVCESCLSEAQQQQDSLVNCLISDRLLLAEKIPPPKTTVVLTDSDSDPSDNEESGLETEYVFEEEDGISLEETILALTKELGLHRQVSDGAKHLEDELLKIQDSFSKLESEYSKTETSLDSVRKDFYNTFRLEIMWQQPLDIGPSSTLTQQDGSGEVIAESSVVVPNENLPPVGPLQRWELAPNEMVYAMKYSLFARWVQAQIMEVETRKPNNTNYRIRYNRNAKGGGLPRIIPGRQLAYYEPCATRIPVGTRIIAKYKDDDPKNTTISGSFYVGIVAEIPTVANKYRYLIFFDDGYAQYVHHADIRVVSESSACSWEDVSSDSREFIKEYLQMYPERPMVRLQKWNYVKTEWNGRWWRAQVKEVDGSLVKMFFPPLEGRCEWIYRGSTRLSPLFHKKMNIQAQAEQPVRTIRRRTAALPSRAVVEYGTFGQDQDLDGAAPAVSAPSSEMPGQPRSVARKSTSRPSRPGTPPKEVLLKVEQESRGFTNQHSFQDKVVKFTNHLCTSQCLGAGDSMKKYKGLSPLLQPLLFGWRRQFVKICRKTVNRYEIYYTAPCGRRLGSIEDVFKYLLMTESNLEVDCFSFELSVMVTHEWEPFKKIVDIEDFSKGEENVPISCVNSLEEVLPQELRYCNVRIPTEDVPLDLDPDFLVCCDCTDECRDKSKCECWQQTIANTRILERQENQSAGYTYRRLFEQVQSGIYECNTKCKCSNHCLNKVVQHPLRLKLQLFKTARRGWGVRTLHDVPRGGFICVYVGRMLNEAIANEEGKIMGGDDYYAELDYIEVMERAKEGYEDEAVNIEDDALYQADLNEQGGSESNDSDSLFSENDTDNTKEDTDFSHPSCIKRAGGVAKREKSARLQERAAKRSRSSSQQKKEDSSRSNSDDDLGKNKKSKTKGKKDDDKEGEKDSDKDDKEGKKDGKEKDEDEAEEEDEDADEKQRQPQPFVPRQLLEANTALAKRPKSIRDYFGTDEAVYIMDAKHTGNIGRFLNHSCEPNVFVQNVFVDTHDLRFPWIAFFAISNIKAGTELTWDYSYDVGSVAGKIKYCYCGARKCRGRLL
ncbi:histone-lysine N-methyltransferase eggless-like isoform X3 [Portunus trituberculatus]|uniref:histone-lysine N-methyltransferase eggless-like isoform X3 n=1 Tax=Portunus trituberculatus TaxID=210409 RepID=UPI001E1CBC5E|nr:histone-lysine N-methyltransferase eggless-like isoform X3 [Portunus trituberculatus]